MFESIIFAFVFIALIVSGYFICDIRYQIAFYRYGEDYKEKQMHNRILDDICDSIIKTIRDEELYVGVDDNNEYLFTGDEIIRIVEYYRDQHRIKNIKPVEGN